jgi:hypothetical protein
MGDLAEEYGLRANGNSSSAAFKWYLRQVCGSVAPLLWARVSRAAWPGTAAVALLAYIAVGIVEFIINWAITRSSGTRAVAYNPVVMFITFPMAALIGYVAAQLRRKAAIVLAAMMLLTVTVMTLSANESLPTWYRIAYFFVGPAAIFIDSGLHSLRLRRS